MNLKSTLVAFALPLFLATAVSAQTEPTPSSTFPKPMRSAQGDWAPHVGLVAGLAAPEGSFDNTASIGIDVGYQPYIPFGLGAELTYYRAPGDGVNGALERTQLLGKGTYNFGGDLFLIKYSYIGLGLGVNYQPSELQLVSAPMIGFDIPVASIRENPLTLGANARYAILEGDNADVFSLNGEIKVWY